MTNFTSNNEIKLEYGSGHIKQFEPFCFSIGKSEIDMLSICIPHLNYRNFEEKNEMYEDYRSYHHQFLPYVNIPALKSKINNVNKYGGQIIFIEPEIKWLSRGLREMAKMSLEDTRKSLDNETNKGTWALDYTEVQLNILTAFSEVINKDPPQNLWDEYTELKQKSQ